MKLENYSKISNLIWDLWSQGKITIDEMLNHIIRVPLLEDENTALKLLTAGFLITNLVLLICLFVFVS